MYIDIHAHLELLDIDKTIRNALDAGVKVIVGTGINHKTNRKVLKLTSKHDMIKATIGLYPIDALATETGKHQSVDIEKEIEFIRQNKDNIIGIGEIGLDYKTGSDKESQKILFNKMLDLAEELDKPVIIHSRKAELDVIEILKKRTNLKIVMHCFSGKKNLMLRAIENGWYFTIPTHVVKSEQHQFLAKEVDLSRLFCETDAPFLSPHQGKKNEPAFVVESYRMIAKIKGLDIDEVAKNIFMNYQRVFK